MSRIDDLIAELCPNGVAYKTLGDFMTIASRRVAGSELNTANYVGVDNLVPDFGGRRDSDYKANSSGAIRFGPGDVLIGNIRPYLKKVWLADREGGASPDVVTLTLKSEGGRALSPEFLYYLIASEQFINYSMQHAKGAKMPRGDKAATLRYRIPVPPIAVQREIVRVLDTFTALEAELEAELEARRRQYTYYRDALLDFNRPDLTWLAIRDIGSVRMCKRIFKEETSAMGDVPFFKIGSFGGTPDAFISRQTYEEYRRKFSFPKVGDVLLSAAGTIGRAIPYNGEDAYYQDSNIVWVDNPGTKVSNRYLFYLYQIIQWETDGGTIRRLYNDKILKAQIAVPSIAEQERIVSILDRFDALVNDISVGLPAELAARRKQYEYYRDRLLTFEELPV